MSLCSSWLGHPVPTQKEFHSVGRSRNVSWSSSGQATDDSHLDTCIRLRPTDIAIIIDCTKKRNRSLIFRRFILLGLPLIALRRKKVVYTILPIFWDMVQCIFFLIIFKLDCSFDSSLKLSRFHFYLDSKIARFLNGFYSHLNYRKRVTMEAQIFPISAKHHLKRFFLPIFLHKNLHRVTNAKWRSAKMHYYSWGKKFPSLLAQQKWSLLPKT